MDILLIGLRNNKTKNCELWQNLAVYELCN